MNENTNILIVDDHSLIIEGLKNILRTNNYTNIFTSLNAEEGLQIVRSGKIDIVIADISLPGMDGIELSGILKKEFPHIAILIVTQLKKIWVIKQLMKIGVNGIILKENENEEVIRAISAISDNQPYYSPSIYKIIVGDLQKEGHSDYDTDIELTKREEEVLQLIAAERTSQEIADKLCVSLKTVETHRNNLLLKFGVRNTAGLIKKVIERGYL
jgi:DNA-binding NarL/FixJ family response regulator